MQHWSSRNVSRQCIHLSKNYSTKKYVLVFTSSFWAGRFSFPCRMRRRPCFGPGAGSGRRRRRSRGMAGRPWWATSRSPGRRLFPLGSAPRHCSPSQARPCRSPCSPCVCMCNITRPSFQVMQHKLCWFLIETKHFFCLDKKIKHLLSQNRVVWGSFSSWFRTGIESFRLAWRVGNIIKQNLLLLC